MEEAKNFLTLNNYEVLGGCFSPVNENYGKRDLLSGKIRLDMVKLSLEDSEDCN